MFPPCTKNSAPNYNDCHRFLSILPSEFDVSQSENNYEVALEVFEGPLDLLLHLIRKHEIDIYDIPIVTITNQYNAYLAKLEELNLGIAGEFILMASTLVQIKSKTMLPVASLGEDPTEDPRDELVRQLMEHQLFKELAESFHEMSVRREYAYVRGRAAGSFEDDGEIYVEADLFDLIRSYRDLCDRNSVRNPLAFERIKVTIGDQIRFVLDELNLFKSLTLDQLFGKLESKIVWIVTFLALLELIRLRYVQVYQTTDFGTIRLARTFERLERQEIAEIAAPFQS